MRTIKFSGRFKKDYRRAKAGVLGDKVDALLAEIIEMLANDKPPPERCRDHALAGEWKDFRDCHIRPDLVLIYRKDETSLELARLGSHSDLGL